MTPTIIVDHVWKQFQIGLAHHRLGDAFTGAWKRWRGQAAEPRREEGKFWALQDVRFTVGQGEVLGIIGRNGAGKSTMLKLLSGISNPTKGSIRTQGTMASLIEVGAGFHPDLTGRENVYLNGTILGLKRRQIAALFDEIVAFAEVERFIDTPVKRYSSGMYVRLGFAIAAHVNPDILLIDEVLSVGDIAFQQKCLARINELKRQQKTMVFISHNLNAVQRICDRAIFLSNGAVIQDGEVEPVIRAYRQQFIQREREQFQASLQREQANGGASRGLRITDVQLRDAAGAPTDSLQTGEPARIEVNYVCARRIEYPVVSISIERMDGLLCYEASTRAGGVATQPLEGQGVITLRFQALNLLPNAYRVSVEVGEAGSSAPLDLRRQGCFFTTTSSRSERGAVRLDHAWDWGRDGLSR